jgi:hypothetical protein
MPIYLKIWNAIIYHFHALNIKIIGYLCTGCPFYHVCQHGSCYGMSWQVQILFTVMLLCTGTHWKGHTVSVCRKWYTAAMVSRLCEWGKRGKRNKIADVGKCSIQMTGTVIILESMCFLFPTLWLSSWEHWLETSSQWSFFFKVSRIINNRCVSNRK